MCSKGIRQSHEHASDAIQRRTVLIAGAGLVAAPFLLGTTATAQAEEKNPAIGSAQAPAAQTDNTQRPSSMKTLVVHYSLTGKTDVVARTLAKELAADARRVEDVEKPSVTWWFIITGATAAIRGVKSEIKPIDTSFQRYDRVFVGSPVWGGSPSTPINAFIAQANFSGKEVIPFMTMGGDDAPGALKKMSERIEEKGGKIVGSFAFSSKSATNEELAAKTREMAQRFR